MPNIKCHVNLQVNMENRMRPKRSFGNFKKRTPELPLEKKVEAFILRNSRNGYFTKFSTIASKFQLSESETWNVVGLLLSEGGLESMHDLASGEMKICETDKKYEIMNMGRKRKLEKIQPGKSNRFEPRNSNTSQTNLTRNLNQSRSAGKPRPRDGGSTGRRVSRGDGRPPNRRGGRPRNDSSSRSGSGRNDGRGNSGGKHK